MARPFDEAESVAARIFDQFPDWVQEDEIFQRYFDNLFDPDNNWNQMRDWQQDLDAYLKREWSLDLDDFFEWEDWRQSYKAHAS